MIYLCGAAGGGQLPKGYCAGGSNVKRIHLVRHGYAHRIITLGDGIKGKTVAFRAQHDGKFFFRHKAGVIDAHRILP